MELLEILKTCETTVVQIAKDAGVTRQAVHSWKNNHLPQKETFDKLAKMEKYAVLNKYDFEEERKKRPVGRPLGSTKAAE